MAYEYGTHSFVSSDPRSLLGWLSMSNNMDTSLCGAPQQSTEKMFHLQSPPFGYETTSVMEDPGIVSCCDCSLASKSECREGTSILSSLACDSMEQCEDNCWEDDMISTDSGILEAYNLSNHSNQDQMLLPESLLPSMSVVSPNSITPLPSVAGEDDSMFDGTEIDSDDAISLISSASSLIDQYGDLRHASCLSLDGNERRSSICRRQERTLSSLPDELICSITSNLSVRSICSVRSVSRQMHHVVSRDEAGWRESCQRLWSQKAFIPNKSKLLYKERKSMEAYKYAICDSRERAELHPQELCYDLQSGEGQVWDFRFKETAGSDWTSFDPWWTGGKARKMIFLNNGIVKEIRLSKDGRTFTLHSPFCHLPNEGRDDEIASSGMEMSWRFVDEPMDLPKRPYGAYIRLTVDGRDVPTYVVHRSSNGDWGFVLESCWGVYSSSPLPEKLYLERQGQHRRPARIRLRRTRDGGSRWLNVDGIESESEDEGEDRPAIIPPRHYQSNSLDSNFSMSTRRQWREALLYNFGAVSLPEGEHAKEEFDRVWNRSLQSSA